MSFNRNRGRRIAIVFLLAVLGGLASWFADRQDYPANVSGPAEVIDGDSLVIAGERIRLVGIDAPEGRQMCERVGPLGHAGRPADWPCGRESADRLRRLIGPRSVLCDVEDVDKYDRLLAVCRVGGRDINRWMVENGWAVSYGRHRRLERAAERARRGIWAGRFERPRNWRDRHRGRRAGLLDAGVPD